MISRKIAGQMEKGSWIRKMFEEGGRLKAIYGADQVFDFSLGNPDLEPPQQVREAIQYLARQQTPGRHGYMSNLGYPDVRQAVAGQLSRQSGLGIESDAVCMTVGAAGALNVALKALLDPGDEVIVLAPYFVEYLSYIDNHGGQPVVVMSDPETLLPDLAAVRQAITGRTKAIIINTPNNPSGAVYPESLLRELNQVLQANSQPIYVLSDEPYRELIYDGISIPSTMACLEQTIVCYSWSKALSLPGERIGYLAVSPRCNDYLKLKNAVAYCNRILGFVNAPAFFQKVIGQALDARVDVSRYENRRNQLAAILRRAGFSLRMPEGGFYLFPRTPVHDDAAFAAACAKERVLVVPGSGFGFPGHIRLCFAVPEATIERSQEAFMAIGRHFGLID